MAVTASDVISDDDVRAVLEERTQEMYQFRRAYRPHDATDLNSNSFNFPQADDDVRGAMTEVGEESDYPRTELNYSNVTANYTKDGFEIAITDEAVSDNVFDIVMDVTEEMAVGAEKRLDSLAWSLIDPNDGNNLNASGPIGGGTGDVNYNAIVDAYTTLLGDEFRPNDFELFVGTDAFGDIAKDDNFTHATDQGDQTVRQGTLQLGFGVPIIPSNTGDIAANEAFMIDTGLYGYESTRWSREVTNYREESNDQDVFKIRHRKDFVVMKSGAAIQINGGT